MNIIDNLYNLGISKYSIEHMLEMNDELRYLEQNELNDKIQMLFQINCTEIQIREIISSNSKFLTTNIKEIFKTLLFLNEIGLMGLNYLIHSNPYILNLEVYEIKNYIDKKLETGKNIENIIEELEENVMLFNEM